MYDLRKMVRETPDVEVSEEDADLFSNLDTSDRWGDELVSYIHHEFESLHPTKKEWLDKDPVRLAVYEKLRAMDYEDLDAIIISWVGKEEVLRSLRHY